MTYEKEILLYIQNHLRNSFMDKIMLGITYMAEKGILYLILIGIMIFVVKKYRKIGISAFIAIFSNLIITNFILKNIVARQRPFDKFHEITTVANLSPKDYSFPSGHTSVAFAFATALYLHDKKLGAIAYVLACLIGFSRMYLGVHYPTDVLGGMIIGIAIAIICDIVLKKVTSKK